MFPNPLQTVHRLLYPHQLCVRPSHIENIVGTSPGLSAFNLSLLSSAWCGVAGAEDLLPNPVGPPLGHFNIVPGHGVFWCVSAPRHSQALGAHCPLVQDGNAGRITP